MPGLDALLSQALSWLALAQRELLLFAAFWFVVGTLDELAVDLAWLWLKLTGRARDVRLPEGFGRAPLSGHTAVLVPAWREAEVIGVTIRHALRAWPQDDLRLYVGCYANDPATISAACEAAAADPRLRLVIHGRAGPTTKADCLNRLYAALCEDEARSGEPFASVVLHDAEDMVHPAALEAIDRGLALADFVQLPVRPEPQPASRWIAGHYGDEFAESHAKGLVVRDALGVGLPAAGVGCGFSRAALERLAQARRADGGDGPFAADCLTEDYELGLLVSRQGRGGRFLRLRDADGSLVATRACFPVSIDEAVRQKARWVHGIAFQGWERLGWQGRAFDLWMALRDRRGPLTAIVLAVAYLMVAIEALLLPARLSGWTDPFFLSPAAQALLAISTVGFLWRAAWRCGFTAREYGWGEGLRAVLRIPVANVIAIMSGRRALAAYLRSLAGPPPAWDKTAHHAHPAASATTVATAVPA